MVMPDRWIKRMSENHELITPFEPHQVANGVISYGLSSFGYDVRVGNEFKVWWASPKKGVVVNPKEVDWRAFYHVEGDKCIIPPNGFALASTVERFRIPGYVMGLCVGKSTYARCGLAIHATPLEPGWEGTLTLELANVTPAPLVVHANEGIAQILFLEGHHRPKFDYSDRQGRYQGQTGITLPRP